VLRDPQLSPLASEVGRDVLLESSADDLIGYYAARVDVERLMPSAPLDGSRTLPATLPTADALAGDLAVSTPAELAIARRVLEDAADERRQRAAFTRDARTGELPPASRARVWLNTDTRSVFGYPPGTRFVAAETNELQMLLAPSASGYEVLFAIPRTKW
jgi:hypothetical protein